MAVDAAAATGSLRTLGTAATSAAAGNDARFTNARTPTPHASTHEPGGSDPITMSGGAELPTAAVGQVLISQGAAVDPIFSGAVPVSGYVAIGTNPAQSGAIRLAQDQPVTARNAVNTADISLIRLNAGNITIGQSAAGILLETASGHYKLDYQGFYPALGNLALGLPYLGLRFTSLALTKEINFIESAAPAVPPANEAQIWLQDNGSGKSQLMIQFATGAPIAIATQA
jgi:hypothetical protein